MVIEGPTLSKPIPIGSIIVCHNLKCRAHIFRLRTTIESGSPRDGTSLEGLIRRTVSDMGKGCPRCGVLFLRSDRRVIYIPPPRSLGDRITNFMYWSET